MSGSVTSRRWIVGRWAMTVAWVAAVTPIGSAGSADLLGQGRLSEIVTAHSVADGRPVGVATEFAPDAGPIVVWFRFEGFAPGTEITCAWSFLGGAAPLRIGDGAVRVTPPTDWGTFSMELAPGKAWPAGQYRVELRAADRVVGDATFSVSTVGSTAVARHRHTSGTFEIAIPAGWILLSETPAGLLLRAPGGNGQIEISTGPTSARLDPVSYAAGWESVSVGPGARLAAKRAGRPFVSGGLPGYEAAYEAPGIIATMAFLASTDRLFVFAGVFPVDAYPGHASTFDTVVRSLVVSR